MTPPLVSLCIPTWNRAHTLPDLLESIARQWQPGLEVIVSDNASTDNTADVVRRCALPLRYRRAKRNRGFDRNLTRLVRMATGDRVWFLGSDDVLVPGAVAQVLDTIPTAPASIVVGHSILCDAQLGARREHTYGAWRDGAHVWLDAPGAVAAYLRDAHSICAAFAFISTQVFPRHAWLAVGRGDWRETGYDHIARFWRMALAGTPVCVRQVPLVYARVGNHNRTVAEMTWRVALDVDALWRVSTLMRTEADRVAVLRLLGCEYDAARRQRLEQRLGGYPGWAVVRERLLMALA